MIIFHHTFRRDFVSQKQEQEIIRPADEDDMTPPVVTILVPGEGSFPSLSGVRI
jgi:hypothetical protein